MIERLKENYDYVVVDTPPVGLVADALELTSNVDLYFYVVRADYSRKGLFTMVNDRFNRGLIKNIYVIVNDLNPTAGGYGYGYYEEEGKKKKSRSPWKRLFGA